MSKENWTWHSYMEEIKLCVIRYGSLVLARCSVVHYPKPRIFQQGYCYPEAITHLHNFWLWWKTPSIACPLSKYSKLCFTCMRLYLFWRKKNQQTIETFPMLCQWEHCGAAALYLFVDRVSSTNIRKTIQLKAGSRCPYKYIFIYIY